MFSEGEYVVYGLSGVCRIEKITTLDMKDIPKDRKYYVLLPVNQDGKKYVPIDTGEEKMRKVITRTEAEELLAKLQEIEPIKITNDRLAEKTYKNCFRCYDCIEWVRLIKCIYQRNQKRITNGKRITSNDEKYMHMAEDALYTELGIVLGIPKEQVLEYIMTRVEN